MPDSIAVNAFVPCLDVRRIRGALTLIGVESSLTAQGKGRVTIGRAHLYIRLLVVGAPPREVGVQVLNRDIYLLGRGKFELRHIGRPRFAEQAPRPDAAGIIETWITLPRLMFPEPGRYDLALDADKVRLQVLPFTIYP